MTELAGDGGRRVFLRVVAARAELDPVDSSRGARGPDAPDLSSDFVETSLSELLAMDLARATLTFDPSFVCDLRCRFCDLPVTSKLTIDWSGVAAVVSALVLVGLRDVHIIGGEPGLHPGIEDLLRRLRDLGVRVTVFTHGMWAVRPARLERLLDAGAQRFVMSLKAFDEETFQAITRRPGGAAVQKAALRELVRAWDEGKLQHIELNHVLTRQTLPTLADIPWAEGLPRQPYIALSLLEPYRDHMADLVPSPDELARTLPRLLESLERRGIPYGLDGVPLCFLGERWARSRDVRRMTDRRLRVNIRPKPEGDYVLAYRGHQRLLQFTHAERCTRCALARSCPGAHKRLLEWWPTDALRPVEGALA